MIVREQVNNLEERVKALEEDVEKEIKLLNRLIDITGEQYNQFKELIQILKEKK